MDLQVLFSLLFVFVVSLFLQDLRDPNARIFFNTIGGFLVSWYVYGLEILYLIPFNMIAYVCFFIAPREKVHLCTIIITMAFMTIGNVMEQAVTATGFNITTLFMISVVKQTQIACNYRDGKGDIDSWLTDREKRYMIKDRPSLTSYLAYLYNLQGSIIGPPCEYKDWDNFIRLK